VSALLISPAGDLQFIYSDELRPYLELGESEIRRASHVEPVRGGWTSDMRPCGGPLLGPFKLRATALARERAWLDAHPEKWPAGGNDVPDHEAARG